MFAKEVDFRADDNVESSNKHVAASVLSMRDDISNTTFQTPKELLKNHTGHTRRYLKLLQYRCMIKLREMRQTGVRAESAQPGTFPINTDALTLSLNNASYTLCPSTPKKEDSRNRKSQFVTNTCVERTKANTPCHP